MEYHIYLDKVHGGWLGKCIGGAAGAPVEGIKELLDIEDYKEVIRADLPNDDLDLQLLWLFVLQQKGWDITSDDLAKAWDQYCWYPFNEYGYFLKNYERGIMPPLSGSFNNVFFGESEGCPIRSEIWGMTSPGDPESAAYYAGMDGCLDHAGEAVWIEQYYAAIEAAAFTETDIKRLLKRQIQYLPDASRSRSCVQDMIIYYQNSPEDWMMARGYLMCRYGHYDFTNAVVNLGIVVIALLYGEGDLDRTINIAFRCGFDTDCTCATAGAILGVILGAGKIPKSLKALVSDEFVIGIDVPRESTSILELAKETCEIGLLEKRREEKELDIRVEYERAPAIGAGDQCNIWIHIVNNSGLTLTGKIEFKELPAGFWLDRDEIGYEKTIQPHSKAAYRYELHTEDELRVKAINIMTVSFLGISKRFGIAGASEWAAVGPFFEALKKEDPKGLPAPHPESCALPTLECMVNNAVYLSREYINEKDFIKYLEKQKKWIIHSYEDLIPVDEAFTLKGQMCIYLHQVTEISQAKEVWVVIGNSDGFVLWVNQKEVLRRDEIRLWTPYNNYTIIKLNKGKNDIVLKLLRRTEQLRFSFALREYNGKHFHKNRWLTDFKTFAKS